MPLVIILALLIIWPVAELFVMIQVAQAIGFFWMLFLLFCSAVGGMLVLRHRGKAHWQRLRGAVSDRKPPAREAFDGVMITTGALLLMIPGFITSAIGLFLLFPPTRFLIRILVFWLFASRFRVVTTAGTWGSQQYQGYRSGRQEYDVEGEAVDVTDPFDEGDPASRQLPSGDDGPDADSSR
ncbi:MAG: FxsA family protein [Actinomycetota bacterium]|nr:FxsA family protein [Actinomycetota bacterium]